MSVQRIRRKKQKIVGSYFSRNSEYLFLSPFLRLILADLDQSFKHLERCLSQPSYTNSQSDEALLNPLDAQVAIIFDLNVLSQIANTSKAIIGVRRVEMSGQEYLA